MDIELIGGASTQSRGQRPLPPGAVNGTTLLADKVSEVVIYDYADGRREKRSLLTWIGGQAGLLFGASSYEWADSLYYTHGSYGHKAEYDLADALGVVYDGYLTDSRMGVRFFQNGGDACSAAVRIARRITGSDMIATQGYHGTSTDFAHEPAWDGYPRAILDLHRRFEFGDVQGLAKAVQGAACIMIEVPAWDDEDAIGKFLQVCRIAADDHGVPLIIDDVVCGFRLALAGSCERYGVKADMVCLGKALSANGNVAALVGRHDLLRLLDDGVFYSTTFGGASGPCAVANHTVRWLIEHRSEVYSESGHLQTIGRALKDGFNARGIRCIGQPERSVFSFLRDEDWLRWCSLMIERGVMVHRPNFPTMLHTLEHVEQTMRAVEQVMEAA